MDKVSQPSINLACVGGDSWCLAIGYSARALAEALRDAGLRVIAVDAFGDKDLTETAKVPQILSSWGAPTAEKTLQTDQWLSYRKLPSSTETDTPLPVFLAGGCENWPDLLEFLSSKAEFKLLADKNQIQALRKPESWRDACRGTEIDFPPSIFEWSHSRPNSAGNRWLLKRGSASGGLGVEPHSGDSEVVGSSIDPSTRGSCYLQEYKPGRVLGVSSILLPNSGTSTPVFIGATESWVQDDWPAPMEFIYRGSFGPIELDPKTQESILDLVENLCRLSNAQVSQAFDRQALLQGWLQLDLVQDQQQLWMLEVNPRWTAGMEVLHLSGMANMAVLHAQSFGIRLPPNLSELTSTDPSPAGIRSQHSQLNQIRIDAHQLRQSISAPPFWVGKSIYYAPEPIELTFKKLEELHGLIGCGFHDIPADHLLNTTIEVGHPVLTITARIRREDADELAARGMVLDLLHAKRRQVEKLLRVGSS